jgi:glycolate oxidase iron-sulfur subunit
LFEGRATPTETLVTHLDLCLACRACEAACPSGVPYGRIIETARASLRPIRPRSLSARLRDRLVFRELLPRPGRLRAAATILRGYQRSGAQSLVRATGLLPRLAPRLAQAERSLPTIPDRFFEPRRALFPARGPTRGRVGLLRGCVMPLLYGGTHAATLRVLSRNGYDVVVAPGQVCCGALNVHAGEREMAREMARRNVDAFLAAGVESVVVNAAGCGSTLKEYGELLAGDPEYAAQAERMAAMTRDVTELLASAGLRGTLGAVRRRVTLQESCHLTHAQRIKDAPRALLARIPGIEFVDMQRPDECCGSAGLYSVFQPEMSLALLDTKMQDVQGTRADTVVTANPGCQLQLELGARRSGMQVDVMHVVDLLDESYSAAERSRGQH